MQRLLALGLQPHMLSSAMLEAGTLSQDGIKVLVLPHAIALSDAEVEAIRRFAASGGTVVADTEPGLFDGHSRLRPTPPLKGVAEVPEAMLRMGGTPSRDALDAQAALLAHAGVAPRAIFLAADGRRATAIEARWFQAGDHALLSLQAAAPDTAPPAIEIVLDAPATLSDLRHRGPAVTASRERVSLDAVEPTILEVHR